MVFMVDYYPENNTYLFRGNTPFNTPDKNNGKQTVDFEKLHCYMQEKFEAQTGKKISFPEYGSYILRDICLQSKSSEGGSILWELESFGGTELSQLSTKDWYPNKPNKPQIINWEIEPHALSKNDVFDLSCAKKLSDLINQKHKIPHIYYIHCASGHDRTGLVASSYLVINRNLSLQKALICGTTISKLTSGSGNLRENCIDINTTTTNPNRSRVIMINKIYDETVLNIYNSFHNNKEPINSIPQKVRSKNPSYVYSTYPWETAKIID